MNLLGYPFSFKVFLMVSISVVWSILSLVMCGLCEVVCRRQLVLHSVGGVTRREGSGWCLLASVDVGGQRARLLRRR